MASESGRPIQPSVCRLRASMRPRPIGLGIWSTNTTLGMSIAGFNEAEANWPRNRRTRVIRTYSIGCFNEAEANWPRNLVREVGVRHTLDMASMRPRPIGLGIRRRRHNHLVATGCFNEAEANWPRNHRTPPTGCGRPTSFNEAEANWPRNPRLWSSILSLMKMLQ